MDPVTTILFKVSKFFIKKVIASSITHALTTIVPKKTLLKATILGKTFTLNTTHVAEILVDKGLDILLDSSIHVNTSLNGIYTHSAEVLHADYSNYKFFEAMQLPRKISISVPISFREFPKPIIKKFGKFDFPKPENLQWDSEKWRWK